MLVPVQVIGAEVKVLPLKLTTSQTSLFVLIGRIWTGFELSK